MMEDAGQTIILRSDVIEVVDELSCKSHKEEDKRIFLLIWPTVSKPLNRPEPLSMPQIPILCYPAIISYPWNDYKKSGFR